MVIDPSCAGPVVPAPDAARALRILALVEDGDMDGAIEAGLPRVLPLPQLDEAANAALLHARDRLLAAWAARERHRARARRLERIAEERRQARAARTEPAAGATAAAGSGTPPGTTSSAPPARPALPAAAAAALARARARARAAGEAT